MIIFNYFLIVQFSSLNSLYNDSICIQHNINEPFILSICGIFKQLAIYFLEQVAFLKIRKNTNFECLKCTDFQIEGMPEVWKRHLSFFNHNGFLFICFMFMSSLAAIPKTLQEEPQDFVIHHLPNTFRSFNLTVPCPTPTPSCPHLLKVVFLTGEKNKGEKEGRDLTSELHQYLIKVSHSLGRQVETPLADGDHCSER